MRGRAPHWSEFGDGWEKAGFAIAMIVFSAGIIALTVQLLLFRGRFPRKATLTFWFQPASFSLETASFSLKTEMMSLETRTLLFAIAMLAFEIGIVLLKTAMLSLKTAMLAFEIGIVSLKTAMLSFETATLAFAYPRKGAAFGKLSPGSTERCGPNATPLLSPGNKLHFWINRKI
jgi:NADH:ubiquinone oxidoreductase subunit 3 (subunit A)